MTPREIIESFARGRSEMANKIRHMRKIVRSKPVDRDAFPIWKEIEWIKRLVYNPVGYGSIQVPDCATSMSWHSHIMKQVGLHYHGKPTHIGLIP
jgi:hypothetical protein